MEVIVIEVQTSTTLDALVRCRQVVMTRANDILTGTPAPAPREDGEAVQTMTALLMTSLEELKVAEEELREQNAALSEIRAAGDQRAHHYRQLFMHIPAPALVTDTQATIIEVNQAAEHLLRREGQYLERKPLAALLHPTSRPDFRTRLSRLVSCEESRHVCLTLNRHGDTPIDVDATVALVPDIDPARSLALFWLFSARPATE
jgi:PAS domain S-box-containing protein